MKHEASLLLSHLSDAPQPSLSAAQTRKENDDVGTQQGGGEVRKIIGVTVNEVYWLVEGQHEEESLKPFILKTNLFL